MLKWIGSALKGVASFVGEGIASVLSWLLSGVLSVLGKILRAFGGVFALLDAIWDFFVGIKDVFLELVGAFFPWVPEDVITVVSLGLLAVLLAGVIRAVRGK